MGRRRSDSHPVPRLHEPSGNARVRIGGKEYWLGRYGSAQARLKFDALIAAWIASGRKSVEAAVRPAAPPPPAPDAPACPQASGHCQGAAGGQAARPAGPETHGAVA